MQTVCVKLSQGRECICPAMCEGQLRSLAWWRIMNWWTWSLVCCTSKSMPSVDVEALLQERHIAKIPDSSLCWIYWQYNVFSNIFESLQTEDRGSHSLNKYYQSLIHFLCSQQVLQDAFVWCHCQQRHATTQRTHASKHMQIRSSKYACLKEFEMAVSF